jgi:hypothetical protein
MGVFGPERPGEARNIYSNGGFAGLGRQLCEWELGQMCWQIAQLGNAAVSQLTTRLSARPGTGSNSLIAG